MELSKKEIRNSIREFRNNLDADEFNRKSSVIFNRIIQESWFEEVETLLVYVSVRNEVDTYRLMDYAFSHGKKVAVPKITDNQMYFYYINSPDQLSGGFFGIPEPVDLSFPLTDFTEKCTIIVPGLAFTVEGHRIGYGGGFYDRFLSENNLYKVGICFKEQIYDRLSTEQHDVLMNQIITD